MVNSFWFLVFFRSIDYQCEFWLGFLCFLLSAKVWICPKGRHVSWLRRFRRNITREHPRLPYRLTSALIPYIYLYKVSTSSLSTSLRFPCICPLIFNLTFPPIHIPSVSRRGEFFLYGKHDRRESVSLRWDVTFCAYLCNSIIRRMQSRNTIISN